MARYFVAAEIVNLRPELVRRLDEARELAGVPFRITSGYRSPSANAAVGGVGNSAHGRGLAVDIACAGSRDRFHIVRGLFAAGFRRIGVYDRHVHADLDDSLPNPVCWTGDSH
jgi:zinc D-Ala-D-Ala carboxypeptidase